MLPKVLFVLSLLMVAIAFTIVHGKSGMESVMGIVDSHRTVNLDPSVQHIPLDPALAHLRPPPARVPPVYDIFVGLSVFRDGHRCGKTIFTGLKRAKNPDRLYFGVVDQVNPGDLKCIDAYCAMADAEWPEHGPCRYRDHIRIDEHMADDSRGPTLARHYQQKLLKDEEFCLQLDGHSLFTNLWDEYMVAEWKRIDNEMAVLTTYIHHMHDFIKPNGDNTVPNSLPHLCTTMRGIHNMVRNVGASMISDSKFPQLSALWGAGLSFSKCHAERRVLVDPHTLWMFDGEEFLRSSHLWTHGYDMYSPSELGSVVYHNYTSVPARFEDVKVDQVKKAEEVEMGVNRFRLIVGIPFEGKVDALEMDKYAFGNVRTFQQYLKFSGVNFTPGVNDTDSCEQLHWVPYTDATDVEKIVGGGWKFERMKAPEPTGIKPAHHQPIVIDDVETNEEMHEQIHKAQAEANTGAGGGEPIINPKFRQEMTEQLSGSSSGFLWVFMVAIAGFLFVMLSNDSVSISIRRFCRTKTRASTK